MSENAPEILTVEDDLSWQRDAAVASLATPELLAAGNEMGERVDVDVDEDNGL